ncbi:S46 family peptidase, partial [Acinetobacter baumannii]
VRMAEERGRLLRFSEENAEHARLAGETIFGLENSYKVYFGRLFALNDKAFMDSLKAKEAALRARSAGKVEGDPWADIAKAQAALREL